MTDLRETQDLLAEKCARIAELEQQLEMRKEAINAQFRLMERVRELEKALRWMKEKQVIWHPTHGLIEEKYSSDYEKVDAPAEIEALVRSL